MQIDINLVDNNPDNPRTITEEAFEKLVNSIKEDPQLLEAIPLICTKKGDRWQVECGNQRLRACKKLGYKKVPIHDATKWTAEQIRRAVVKTNILLGKHNYDILTAQYDAEELSAWGMEGLDQFFIEEPDEKDDEVPEIPEEPKSKLGDLYELGEHRVLCGDSTKVEDVEKLMDGQKADMVFTDPPYGMDLDTDYSKMGKSKTKYDKVIGDETDFDISFMFDLLPSPIYYIWGAEYLYDTIPNFKQGSLAVWAKRQSAEENKVFGSAYELCWVFPKIKKEIWFVRSINQSSERLGKHPTQKPTELGVRAINDRTEPENLIADLFLGSGSTLIASEKTNRKCYGMELDPKYVDVIVQRYVDHTGNNKIKLNGKEIIWETKK